MTLLPLVSLPLEFDDEPRCLRDCDRRLVLVLDESELESLPDARELPVLPVLPVVLEPVLPVLPDDVPAPIPVPVPDPKALLSVGPVPVEPVPVEPLPVALLPVEPLPVEPLPVEPLPVEPLPMPVESREVLEPLPERRDPLLVPLPMPLDPLPGALDPLPVALEPLPELLAPLPMPVDPVPCANTAGGSNSAIPNENPRMKRLIVMIHLPGSFVCLFLGDLSHPHVTGSRDGPPPDELASKPTRPDP